VITTAWRDRPCDGVDVHATEALQLYWVNVRIPKAGSA
jgi:hypothetical protein